MPQCKHYKICGRDSDGETETDLCILHSQSPDKNKQAFGEALDTHRRTRGDNFYSFIFPGETDFRGVTFSAETNFREATFSKTVNFIQATFSAETNFSWATFSAETDFSVATFNNGADFSGATFSKAADFQGATFSKVANFQGATFNDAATFSGATFNTVSFAWVTFSQQADFSEATFGQLAIFGGAKFFGRALFTVKQEQDGLTVPIFFNTAVDFRAVILEPLDGLILRDADLRQCQFLDTDLRKAEITGATWPTIGRRVGVYDEDISEKGASYPWSRLERLYRELKHNYEDRRDYERAGDFHYGEKEMRRKNPQTPITLKCFLWLYWVVSGYGERYLRPLIWAGALYVSATILYLWLGLRGIWAGGGTPILSMANVGDWLKAANYSFHVMTFLKPEEVAIPLGWSRHVNTIQSLLSPLFLGLFALALRQRLKR